MSLLSIQNLTKFYGRSAAVSDLSLEVAEGEFHGLLGPSGCGKTTLLRIVAGLTQSDRGVIEFDGEDISKLPPERRGFGMVFQNYALFPHLNVFENVAFGLRARRLPGQEVRERVSEALALVDLEGIEQRRIDELSGGQQQRVNIARAISIRPRLLLFDEPLSNLDESLRERTRDELRELVARLGLTSLYVTHDQEEAFALCQRVSVMGGGKILQTGRPRTLYERPEMATVARFLGRNNLFSAKPLERGDAGDCLLETVAGGHRLKALMPKNAHGHRGERSLTLSIRPERLQITKRASGAENVFAARICGMNYAGATTLVKLDAGGLSLEALTIQFHDFQVGDECFIELPPQYINVLGNESKEL